MTVWPNYRFRQPLNSPEQRGARPAALQSARSRAACVIERDVEIPTRFGYALYADVFRPLTEAASVPPLLAWTPYGKHDPAPLAKIYPASGVQAAMDVRPDDLRGARPGVLGGPRLCRHHDRHSRGLARPVARHLPVPGGGRSLLRRRRVGRHTALEQWTGRPLGSLLSRPSMQWRVAALNPPHLAAINPWEGWTDTYREVVRHGGIPDTHFWPYIQVRWGASTQMIEDLWAETAEHPFFDGFWASKAAALERRSACRPTWWRAGAIMACIRAGLWKAFVCMASAEQVARGSRPQEMGALLRPGQSRPAGCLLRSFPQGQRATCPPWPRVEVEIRERYYQGQQHASTDWPLPEVDYQRFHLAAPVGSSAGTLTRELTALQSSCAYDSLAEDAAAVFDLRLDTADRHCRTRQAETVCSSADEADDLDLFVALEKLDAGRAAGRLHALRQLSRMVRSPWAGCASRTAHSIRSARRHYLPVLAHTR